MSDAILLLSELWGLEEDVVRLHWTGCLFATRQAERGREVRV